MIFSSRQPHIVSTLMLLGVALLPVQPLITNSAYGDIETSVGNMMRASGDFELALVIELDEFNPESILFSTLQAEEPTEEGSEVAGTSTSKNEPEVEVSDEPLEVVAGTSTPTSNESGQAETLPEVEVSEESLEIIEATSTESSPEPEEATEPEVDVKEESELESEPAEE